MLPHRNIKLYHHLKWHFNYEYDLEKRFYQLKVASESLFNSIDVPHYDDLLNFDHEMVIYYDQFPHSFEKDIAFAFSVVNRFSQILMH